MPQHEWQPGERLAIGKRDLVGGGRDHKKVHGWAMHPDPQETIAHRLCDNILARPHGIYNSIETYEEFHAFRRRVNPHADENTLLNDVCKPCMRIAARRPPQPAKPARTDAPTSQPPEPASSPTPDRADTSSASRKATPPHEYTVTKPDGTREPNAKYLVLRIDNKPESSPERQALDAYLNALWINGQDELEARLRAHYRTTRSTPP